MHEPTCARRFGSEFFKFSLRFTSGRTRVPSSELEVINLRLLRRWIVFRWSVLRDSVLLIKAHTAAELQQTHMKNVLSCERIIYVFI